MGANAGLLVVLPRTWGVDGAARADIRYGFRPTADPVAPGGYGATYQIADLR